MSAAVTAEHDVGRHGALPVHVDELTRLAADRGSGRVSLFMPIGRIGPSNLDDRTRFVDLVLRAQSALQAEGQSTSGVDAILSGAWELIDDLWLWERPNNGLAMFASPESTRCYWVPTPLPELVAVGNRFTVGPLLPVSSTDTSISMPSLAEDKARLFRQTGSHYLQDLYREVNAFPDVLLPTITGDLADVAPEAIHRRAWSTLEPELRAYEDAATDMYHVQQGTGRTGTDPAEALAAARQGRVDTLFVSAEAAWWGHHVAEPVIVRLGAASPVSEQLEETVLAVLRYSGAVITLPVHRMPEHVPIAALLRH